jgi:hypothetical protein
MNLQIDFFKKKFDLKKELARRSSKYFNLMLYHVLIATCIKKKKQFLLKLKESQEFNDSSLHEIRVN